MGRTRGKKKSGSRKSRKCDVLQPLSKQILKGGNSSGANEVRWATLGTYNVVTITGSLRTSSCPNNVGKDGPLGTATLYKPLSIDIDSTGNILVAEKDTKNKIRMISPAGNVSTLVTRGNLTDGALASSGGIHNTGACVVNKATDVFYFMEYAYHQFRSIIADSGKTFSGKSAPGFTAGLTTIVSTSGNKTQDGEQGNAFFNHPTSIAIDPRGGRIYVGEEDYRWLRMIDITGPKSCYVSTLFKLKATNEEFISHITVDYNGNVFYVVNNRHAIWKYVPPAAGVRTTGGSNAPLHVFDDPAKGPKLFAGNHTVSGYNDANGPDALFNAPMGLCVDKNNNLYVADRGNNIIRYITPDGSVYTYAGAQSNEPNLDNPLNDDGNGSHRTARFSNPVSVAMDPNGDLVVLDAGKKREDQCTPYARVRRIARVPTITINAVTTESITLSWSPVSEWMPNPPAGEDTNTYSFTITPSDRDFEVLDDIQSPLTISNLSDSTRYTIEIVASSPSRTVKTLRLPFVTKTEPSHFAIRTPVTTTVSGKKNTGVESVTTTVLEWDGAKGTDTLSYSIDPPDVFSRTTVTIPRNQKSPYCIADLEPSKTYTVRLTASITDAPGINGQPSEINTVTSNPSTFTTADPRPMEIGTICGILKEGKIVVGGETTNASKIPRAASTTSVKNPRGIVLDKHGNLFVTSNSCVLKITPPKENMYVYMRGEIPSVFLPTPHTKNNSNVTIYAGLADNTGSPNNNPSDGATGDSIRFYNMSGMAYDPIEDAVYISDSQLHVVVKLTSDSAGLVTSKVLGLLAGFSHLDAPVNEAKFHTPKGIAIGPDGSLFIADCYNHAVRRIYKGNVTTISRATKSGPVTYSDKILYYPYGVAALYDGTVYVTSTWRNCIKKLTPNPDGITYTTTLYAGEDTDGGSDATGKLLDARFNKPQGLFVDINNNIYVYDAGNYKIKLISGGRVMTVFGSSGYRDGNKDDAALMGPPLSGEIDQTDFGGITSDNNGNIYITDCNNGFVRCAFPEPPPVIDKATFDNFWQNRDASSAHAQKTSSARLIQASSAKIQRASSSVANKASSALAQTESRAHASSAQEKQASSSVEERASSALAQKESTANASSALAQAESSPLAQEASSALAEKESSAQESSALIQGASSAVAQVASSALAQHISGARESSAVAQVASSAVAQIASSAVAQGASSAVAQGASMAQASSARQQQALVQPVGLKDAIVKLVKSIQSDLTQQVAILYSRTSTEADKNAAKEFIMANMADLEGQWVALSQVSAKIFAIAPMYQDRELQTAIYDDRYIESKKYIKMYDFMRKKYIAIDSNGYIVSNVDALKKRLR